jgi:predicted regulator of amino acid metabolism with ACT domain
MPRTEIIVTASTDMELVTRKTVLDAVNALSTDQLKRVSKMLKSPKAIAAISSDIKFALLQKFI